MLNKIGSLIRDLGLGFFVNGLFTITQNGYSFNSLVVAGLASFLIIVGIILQDKGK